MAVSVKGPLGGRPRALRGTPPTTLSLPMPIYEYRCLNGHTFEVIQSMSDDPVETCEVCGAPVERVFHPVAVHFKGSGFYTTDYANKAKAGAGKDGGSSDSGSSDSGSSESGSSSETKSSSKGEDKATSSSSSD
jgi:putative FmdB family regulatory protein